MLLETARADTRRRSTRTRARRFRAILSFRRVSRSRVCVRRSATTAAVATTATDARLPLQPRAVRPSVDPCAAPYRTAPYLYRTAPNLNSASRRPGRGPEGSTTSDIGSTNDSSVPTRENVETVRVSRSRRSRFLPRPVRENRAVRSRPLSYRLTPLCALGGSISIAPTDALYRALALRRGARAITAAACPRDKSDPRAAHDATTRAPATSETTRWKNSGKRHEARGTERGSE